MANEPSQGWMLSKGRIRTYLEEYILDDNIVKTINNLIDEGMDIIINRRNSTFFQLERSMVVGWYTGDEINGFIEIQVEEAFHLFDIYLNAMGDNANSFLYYMLR